MASGKWTFTQPFKGWSPGDSIEPNMCMSGEEFVTLRRAGALVQAEEYKPSTKRAPLPVVETADAPPLGETAARTTRGQRAKLKTASNTKEDVE